MKSLTPAQAKVLSAFQAELELTGLAPTYRALGARLRCSAMTVHQHVQTLIRKGVLDQRGGTRGLAPHGWRPTRLVPILGQVPAGVPLLAEENLEGTVAVDQGLVRRGPVFALRVQGDSMTGAGILDGDLVIVRQQAAADPGDIVVARLGDEATVKRLRVLRGHPVWEPANPAYAPIPAEEAEMLGKVVGLVRRYPSGPARVS